MTERVATHLNDCLNLLTVLTLVFGGEWRLLMINE